MEEAMHKLIDKIVWLGIILVGAMLVAQLTFVKGAWAQKSDPFLIEMRAVELTKWVAMNTAYEPHPPPPIVYMDQATMSRVTQNPNIRALYFPNMMVLGTEFRLGEHDHILVHELTHHLQFTRRGGSNTRRRPATMRTNSKRTPSSADSLRRPASGITRTASRSLPCSEAVGATDEALSLVQQEIARALSA
jgi:hypothetical protein